MTCIDACIPHSNAVQSVSSPYVGAFGAFPLVVERAHLDTNVRQAWQDHTIVAHTHA